MNGPDFIMIGAMKSATSTLHEQLAAQPGLAMSCPKEPNYFSDDDVYARGPEWYARCFAGEGTLRGESSTHYTKLPTYPRTLERMLAYSRDLRFIYVMRHPVDRLVSHYIHEWTEGRMHDALSRAVNRHPELIAYSRYAWQLRPYLEAYGRQRVLPVFFDRIRTDPQSELERVCRFLGYQGAPQWRTDRDEQNVSRRRLKKSRLREGLMRVPGLRPLVRGLVPPRLRDRLNDVWRMPARPKLSNELATRLADTFNADLANLGNWLGCELTCETFVAATSHQSLEWATTLDSTLHPSVPEPVEGPLAPHPFSRRLP